MAVSPASPYNFVRIAEHVWEPDGKASPASHDVPFEDGVCGALEVELRCHAPLMVGGQRENNAVGFFRTPGGQRAVPGSSLRGMLRNVLEIAAFGRMGMVDDRRIGIRDLSDAGKELYRNHMLAKSKLCARDGRPVMRSKSRAGWLTFEPTGYNGHPAWMVRPCELIRVEQNDLFPLLEGRQLAKERYQKLGERHEGPARRDLVDDRMAVSAVVPRMPHVICRSQEPHLEMRLARSVYERGEAPEPAADDLQCLDGWLVFTGHTGARNRHRECIFGPPKETALPVPPEVWRGFLAIHGGETPGTAWSEWSLKLKVGEIGRPDARIHGQPAEPGIPVFWLSEDDVSNKGDKSRIATLGLALMFKMAFPLSVHDTIRKTAADHLQQGGPDVPELLFGSAAQEDGGMRGRVTCGLAIEETETRGPRGVKLILNSPKPSYYPFYVRQDMGPDGLLPEGAGWRGYAPPAQKVDSAGQPVLQPTNDAGPEIRGWKRYPARSDAWRAPPEPASEQNRVATTLCDPAAAGAAFRFQIRLHNLRPFELGALAWALGFGEEPATEHEGRKLRHGLGMAKPYGFGLVTLRVTGGRLIHNRLAEDGQEVVEEEEAALDRLRSAMNAFVERITAWTEHDAELGPWKNTPQYCQLLAMALPRPTAKQPELGYMTLTTKPRVNHFADLKAGRRTLPDPDRRELKRLLDALLPPAES
jgi:CRISPR-associated protein (TIGR03986 family)